MHCSFENFADFVNKSNSYRRKRSRKMHEMSLVESIIELVEDTAKREHARRVKRVVLEIGELSCVAPDALQFCFDAVTRGGVADGAILDILAVPGEGQCMQCAAIVPLRELYDSCPACGAYRVQPTAGTGMRVKEIEIE
jgi:hydrogenase nickel incorporation protein HypA/HybF